ncbi:MAG: threonine/serine exporter family protein, partial [Erysipelotrichaceae bacterium]
MNNLIQLVSKVGQILLENGAEVYRVEETVTKIASAYKAQNASCFVMPTGIFCSFVLNGQSHSLITRIKNSTTNLTKVDLINQLSRDVCTQPIPLEVFDQRINEIENITTYPLLISLLAGGFVACGFTLFFKGTLY